MRRLNIDSECQICVEKNESIFHVMFDCRLSKQIWREVCPWVLEVVQGGLIEYNVIENLFIKSCQENKVEVVCVTLWLIWFNRNKVIHDHVCQTSFEIVKRVKENVECRFYEPEHEVVGISRMSEIHWQPPPANVIKLNADASFVQSLQETSFGVVARDEQGKISFSATARITNVRSPLQAKVMAIFFGVKLMFEHGWLNVIVESDCKTAISLINGDVFNLWEDGAWIEDILGYAEQFNSISFRHIR